MPFTRTGRHLLSSVICLFLGLMAPSGPAAAELSYRAETPIIGDDHTTYAIEDFDKALDAAYRDGLPVILYLHGRGDEPQKSFTPKMIGGGAVPRLRDEYGARVVLLNWNSKPRHKDDRKDPLKHADEFAEKLNLILLKLADYQSAHETLAKPSLLVHSMGSIVLAKSIEKFGWPASANASLFSNILLTQADADSQGHAEWLNALTTHEQVFVTQNRDDPVLQSSKDERPSDHFALGLEPVPPLANGATYVDLTKALGKKRIAILFKMGAHQLFDKSWMGGNMNTCLFITKALHGESDPLKDIPGFSASGPNRYRAQKQISKKHPCFLKTSAGGDTE